MTFRSRTLFVIVTILCIIGLLFQWIQHAQLTPGMGADSRALSGKIEVLDMRHVRRSCACPQWIPATLFNDSAQLSSDAYVYLEPASPSAAIPPRYWALEDSGYRLRLRGEFYQGKTIPRDYAQKTAEPPQPAKVFYFTSSQLIKPE
jgi:hypothetical protein